MQRLSAATIQKIGTRSQRRNDNNFRPNPERDVEQLGEEISVSMTVFGSHLWRLVAAHYIQEGKLDPEWQLCKLLGMGRKTLRVRFGNDTHWTLEDFRKIQEKLHSEEFKKLYTSFVEGE